MSELKPYIGPHPIDHTLTEYYLKSEADRYIAELQSANQLEIDEWYNKLMRQKYKRCLAMARLCHERSLWWYSKGYGFEKYDKFWEKWEKRWLELAEKFKEAK